MANISSKALERATNKYPDLPPRAALVADFIETYCTLSKGEGVSSPFVLIPWQHEVLAEMYPGMPNEERTITRALISMSRKNGKTEFCSALLLAHLCGPESGVGQEIICAAAASLDQAGLVFNGARTMAKAHPIINRGMTYRDNRLIWKLNTINNYAKAIGTRYSSSQGLLPALWFLDEIAELTTRELYESLNYAQTRNGLGIIISTRSNRANSLFNILHDEAVIGHKNGINKHWLVKCWSADPKAKNIYSMEQVRAANPSIGYILNEEDLERDLENAISNVSARSEFRARRLNIESGSNDALIDPNLWADAAAEEEPIPLETTLSKFEGEDLVLGIDLGSTTSMTSLALYWPKHKFVLAKNWMAKSQVVDNEILHKAPYSDWAEAGYLDLIEHEFTGGMSYTPIANFIAQCYKRFNVLRLRFDGWNINRIFDELKKHDLHQDQYPLKGSLDKFIQGTQSYGEAIIEFEDMMYDKTLKHDGNPLTNMSINVCQVEVVNRTTENLKKPAKNKGNLPNDAACAIIMAVSTRDLAAQYDDDIPDDFFESYGDNVSHVDDPLGLNDLFD